MELVVGDRYDITVVNIVKSGAIVELKDGSTELIHISNLSNKYVQDISEFVQIGDMYTAIAIPGRSRDIELSLKTDVVENPVRQRQAPKPSLDEMISKANAAYEDKMFRRSIQSKPRRGGSFRSRRR